MGNNNDTDILYKKEIKYAIAIGDWIQYKPKKSPFAGMDSVPYKTSKISSKDFSKLLTIHSDFIGKFLNSLQTSLKLNGELFTSSAEQLFYGNFIKRMEAPLLYAKLSLGKLGEVVLCIDFSLINSIINFSLGCPNKSMSPRALTEVEESMVSSILEKNLENFTASWQNVFEKPELSIISCPAPTKEPNIHQNEIITQFTFVVSLGGAAPSKITFLYQNVLLRPLIEQFNAMDATKPLNLWGVPEGVLENVHIPVTAELGDASITTQELFTMEEGDIVQLDNKLGTPLLVHLGKEGKALGQIGLNEGKFAVKVFPERANIAPSGIEVGSPMADTSSEDQLEANAEEVAIEQDTTPQTEDSGVEEVAMEQTEEGTAGEAATENPLEEEGKQEYNAGSEDFLNDEGSQ